MNKDGTSVGYDLFGSKRQLLFRKSRTVNCQGLLKVIYCPRVSAVSCTLKHKDPCDLGLRPMTLLFDRLFRGYHCTCSCRILSRLVQRFMSYRGHRKKISWTVTTSRPACNWLSRAICWCYSVRLNSASCQGEVAPAARYMCSLQQLLAPCGDVTAWRLRSD